MSQIKSDDEINKALKEILGSKSKSELFKQILGTRPTVIKKEEIEIFTILEYLEAGTIVVDDLGVPTTFRWNKPAGGEKP